MAEKLALRDAVVRRLRKPPSRALRFKFLLTGFLFPTLTLIVSGVGYAEDPAIMWQSGNLDVYASLLLRWNQSWVFVPLIVCSMLCLSAWIYQPSFGSKWPNAYWLSPFQDSIVGCGHSTIGSDHGYRRFAGRVAL